MRLPVCLRLIGADLGFVCAIAAAAAVAGGAVGALMVVLYYRTCRNMNDADSNPTEEYEVPDKSEYSTAKYRLPADATDIIRLESSKAYGVPTENTKTYEEGSYVQLE